MHHHGCCLGHFVYSKPMAMEDMYFVQFFKFFFFFLRLLRPLLYLVSRTLVA